MALRLNTNMNALVSQRAIGHNVQAVNRGVEHLASGLRVSRAADDASGLVVSEGMRGELSGLTQNVRNAEHAVDLVQVAEGSLQEVNNMLVRMRSLAVQSSSGTLNDANRESLGAEFSQLVNEVDRIAQATSYNGMTLLTGFGNQVSSVSTAIIASSATGVARVQFSAAQSGTFSFVDTAGDDTVTLGNGTVSQTLDLGTILDGGKVATGTSIGGQFRPPRHPGNPRPLGGQRGHRQLCRRRLEQYHYYRRRRHGGRFPDWTAGWPGPPPGPEHRRSARLGGHPGFGSTVDQFAEHGQDRSRRPGSGDRHGVERAGKIGNGAEPPCSYHFLQRKRNREYPGLGCLHQGHRYRPGSHQAQPIQHSAAKQQSMLVQANVQSIQALSLL